MWRDCQTVEEQRRWYAYMLTTGPLKNVKDYEQARNFQPKISLLAFSARLSLSRWSKHALA